MSNPKNKHLIVLGLVIILISAIAGLLLAQQNSSQSTINNQVKTPIEEPQDQTPTPTTQPQEQPDIPPAEEPQDQTPPAEPTQAQEQPDAPLVETQNPAETKPETYLTFTGDEFNQLFNQVESPNLAPLSNPPSITDDKDIDQRIQQIATDRGYRLRPMPADLDQLVVVEAERHRLQPQAAQAYEGLKAAAGAEGLGIWLVSAYRSYDYQRPLFLKQVSAPYDDEAIFERLKLVAIPGYSKHHTGYTIDIAEGNLVFGDFSESASYAWLAADNYKNAKKHGWIPSYPPDAQNQGPDPEPWEFTYVGKQHLVLDQLQNPGF